MKHLFYLAFFVFSTLITFGQDCAKNYLGTKTLYRPQQTDYTLPPKGYTPVLINYAGRHGARHLTKNINTSFAYQLIMKADSSNALKSDGKRLKAMVISLQKVEGDNYKSISEEGKSELQGIAERMYNNNRTVFKNASLKVNITKEIRTKQSAEAFLAKLTELNIPVNVPQAIDDSMLRFYDMSPAYTEYKTKGSWLQQMQDLKNRLDYGTITDKIISGFFSNSFLRTIQASEKEDFIKDIFGFVSILYSIQKEMDAANITRDKVNFNSFFTCDELKIYHTIDEAEDYFLKGPGNDNDGIQINIAAPLLMDFINTTTHFIETKSVNVFLRFTHAEAGAPLAGLMSITTTSQTAACITKISAAWDAAKIIPLSANIQWIVYGNENSDGYLVKFLLNEKEVAISGLPQNTFPFYRWKDVYEFYTSKLNRLKNK